MAQSAPPSQTKVIVITGASSGFGRGVALQLAADGASLVLAARRAELLAELARECERAGAWRALSVPTDVSVREEVERLADAAVRQLGRIDVWINDAGVGALGPFERVPLELHAQVVKTDLLGTLYGSYCAYQQFVKQGSGTLINVSSGLGREPASGYSSYCAAKHGVVGLSETLRQEVEEKGLRGVFICTVMPGAHDTPFFDHAANYTGRKMQPPRPLRDPRNVVDAIASLVQDPENPRIVPGSGVSALVTRHRRWSWKARPAPAASEAPTDSPGAVSSPLALGTGVSAGRR
jgi:NAD(P)-dependent dehydrogenase (short-subunit alcohol dehydrogenase family)